MKNEAENEENDFLLYEQTYSNASTKDEKLNEIILDQLDIDIKIYQDIKLNIWFNKLTLYHKIIKRKICNHQ